MSELVSPTLLKIFRSIDNNFKVIFSSVSTNSVYYKVGVLKVRISDHLKKDVNDLENGCLNLIKFPGSRSYLVGIKGSVFMKQISIKNLKNFIVSEINRLQYFFPEDVQELCKSVKYAEVPNTIKSCGLESTYVKYCNCEDVRKYKDMAVFGNIVKCVYGELQTKYRSGQAKKIYNRLTDKTTYQELKDIISSEIEKQAC